jgi:sarcosine oxidase
VEVLEAADDIGHASAGSKGDARIFRLGYPEPHYAEMAVAARALWRELEASSGRPLLHVTGQVSFGDDDALGAVAESLAGCGEAVERLSTPEARARFPGIVLPGPGPVLFEPQSGVLAAAECLRALTEAGRFEVRFGRGVVGLDDDDQGVTVRCAGDRAIRTDVVVDCAGPGALALLGADAHTVGALPSQPQVAYFTARPGAVEPGRLPVFIEWGDAMIYGLPVPGAGPHAGTFKVSHHTPGPALADYDPSAPTTPSYDDDPALLTTLTEAVRRVLPGLDPEPVATERCVYDNSVDGDFVLDRVGNVVVGCGTSGHGFKFGPLWGEVLADLAEDGDDAAGTAPRSDLDLRPFRLTRHPHPSDQPRSASR